MAWHTSIYLSNKLVITNLEILEKNIYNGNKSKKLAKNKSKEWIKFWWNK